MVIRPIFNENRIVATLILDEYAEERVLAERRANGLDRFDEVWDGVYIMSPLANNEHQFVASELSAVIREICRGSGAKVFAACNVSDREVDWKENYRCPDVAAYYPTNPARDQGTHWFGGPDFAVEVISQKDRTWEKLGFYASIQTRELLIIDRNPWKLSLLRLVDQQLVLVGESTGEDGTAINSEVLGSTLRLVARPNQKPLIEIRHPDGRSWTVDPE